ncbi:hypothetical protein KP803_11245 [Vibrio sp. ZSDE26]|uniref:Uncharacterized protein n=1 Tax=Vibrio amylolyticus TaxID=2847292 RepID=A0A9X1XQS8_9VIBR|nr:hypothetical protein [Vibrio amylolyticus]MCK6263844.1 hypothetical protein [Vibrio amylolyticus]
MKRILTLSITIVISFSSFAKDWTTINYEGEAIVISSANSFGSGSNTYSTQLINREGVFALVKKYPNTCVDGRQDIASATSETIKFNDQRIETWVWCTDYNKTSFVIKSPEGNAWVDSRLREGTDISVFMAYSFEADDYKKAMTDVTLGKFDKTVNKAL